MTEHKTLWEALLAVQANAPALPKDATNPHFKSRFTKLDTIVEIVGKLLNEHGLVWTSLPSVHPETGQPALNYRLVHSTTGEAISGFMPLLAAKEDPQAQGSAITYARRYSLTAVLNLCTDEDDDGNNARRKPEPQMPPLGPTYDKGSMAKAVGLACTQLAGDADRGRTLYKLVVKDCEGYMPMAAAIALIRAAETDNLVPDVEAPEL